jgi:hypothetical protein
MGRCLARRQAEYLDLALVSYAGFLLAWLLVPSLDDLEGLDRHRNLTTRMHEGATADPEDTARLSGPPRDLGEPGEPRARVLLVARQDEDLLVPASQAQGESRGAPPIPLRTTAPTT